MEKVRSKTFNRMVVAINYDLEELVNKNFPQFWTFICYHLLSEPFKNISWGIGVIFRIAKRDY